MRILFTRFPLESADGGAENQTQWLMEGLRARGHEVCFLGSCSILLERCSKLKAQSSKLFIGAPPVTKWLAFSFLWRRAAMRKELIQAMQSFPETLDAIFMLSLSEKLLLTEWAAAQGIKVFWIEHDRIGRWLTNNPWLPALRKESEKAMIICVSELSKKLYGKIGFNPERIVAIPNGVPLLHEREFPISNFQFPMLKVGTLARLSPEKGIDVLMEAIADLPEVSLTIVGSGPEESEIRRLILADTERLGIDMPRIILRRTVDDLASFYHSLDVFVLPSAEHDPFGLVAAEAMMCGTATIVTDACGIAGYLKDHQDAFIVQAGSASALRDAMRRLEEPECRQAIGMQGQRTASERFSAERMVDDYEQLLQENIQAAVTCTRIKPSCIEHSSL